MLKLLLPLAILFLAACDPCSGVASCAGAPRVSYTGRMLVHSTGLPAPGVRVDFIRTGGIAVAPESVSVQTGPDGYFQLELAAGGKGAVVGDVVVRPPGLPSYRVPGVRLLSTEVRGDGGFIEPWVVDPYIAFLGELFLRGTGERLGFGGAVEFRRTGGIQIDPDTVRTQTTSDGRFFLSPRALEPGEVVGDLTVLWKRHYTIRGVRIRTTHLAGATGVGGVWSLGSSLQYVGEIVHRATGEKAAGVEVEFRRTGGIATSPESFVATTDAGGRFPFKITPLEEGTVKAELVVRLPAPHQAVTIPVEISTFDTDEVRLAGVWSVGPHLGYVGELRYADTGKPAAGVEVEFRRTGGIPLRSDVVVEKTNADGRFRLMPVPLATGEVVGTLTARAPAPYATFTTEIRLSTFDTDDVRLAGVWYVPAP